MKGPVSLEPSEVSLVHAPRSEREALMKEFERSRLELSLALNDLQGQIREADPRRQIVNNPMRALAVGFCFGLLVGLATGGTD